MDPLRPGIPAILTPLSRYFGELEADVVLRQERQIVQS